MQKKIKNSILLIFILLVIQNISFAQRNTIEWDKIPKADLVMTVYEKDTTAVALVLGDIAIMNVERYSNSYRTRISRHRRIKILKESGFSYGDVEIPYYSHENMVGMSRVTAQIFNPDGTKIELKKKDVFDEPFNEYWSVAKFAFPNIQVGSVIEWKYETLSKNVHLLPTWYFQEEIPTRHSELQFSYPENFSYTYLYEGNAGMTKRMDGEITILEGEAGTIRVSKNKFIMSNGVAMKEEPYITTMADYKARVRFQLDSYFNYEGVLVKELSSWEEVAKDLDHQWYFGLQINKKKYIKDLLPLLSPQLNQLKTENEKAQLIYNYVAENFTWDGTFRRTVDKTLDKVIEQKQGSSAELNLLQIALLRSIGIEAQPMLISTRSNGKMYEKFPMLHQFNHVLVYTNLDGKEVNIDVPNEIRPMNLPLVAALHGRGAVISNNSATWVDVKYHQGSDTFAYDLELDETGTLSGNLQSAFKGYHALPERRYYKKGTNGEHWLERFSENYPEVTIDSVEFENLENPNKTFKDKLNIHLPEAAQVVGDFIYFNPVLYSNFSENMFKLEKRYFPVDFSYPFSERIFTTIKIPEGYKVEELPQSANFAMAGRGGSFRYVVEQKDEQHLQIVTNLRVQQIQFSPAEYLTIKELFNLVEEKMGEQIVLKKID